MWLSSKETQVWSPTLIKTWLWHSISPEGIFESERAYQYLVDGRGQRLTDLLCLTSRIGIYTMEPERALTQNLSQLNRNDWLFDCLASEAVSSRFFQNITEFQTSGILKVKSIPIDVNAIEKFWLPRSALMRILQEEVSKRRGIRVLYNTKCDYVDLYDTDGGVDRSHNQLTRTWHNLIRTWHNLTRTCHNLTRTCHNLTRTCHNLTRTWHNLTRTCHNLTRTCHNLTEPVIT